MYKNRAKYRVIYGDTDTMGIAYHANYLRWFEIGRTELFRSLGLPYKSIEEKGIMLPVSEMFCKFVSSARYDDILIIESTLDISVRAGMKFLYSVLKEDDQTLLAEGYTLHACVNKEGRVVRPPKFLKELVDEHFKTK